MFIFLGLLTSAWAKNSKELISEVFMKFENAKYSEVIAVLNQLEKRIKPNAKNYNKVQGLVYYWKAMSYSRLNDYEFAEKFFIKALDLKYFTQDIYYEYGQVLYVASKYKRARIAFKKSVNSKYKVGVSLYYIAFISQELKDYKKAVRFYKMIERLPAEEKNSVLQAARMQVGDVYLQQIERGNDPFQGVKEYVIPQYEQALEVDEKSALAAQIRQKIESLQRKYEIVLFRMRNGKPTARPPHYIRANFLYGLNDNVSASSEDTKSNLSTEDYSSSYYEVGFFSRYSFYPSDSFAYAPEFSFGLTQYTSDSTNILPYNKYYVKGALKMNYEHSYKSRPATFYIDLDYTYNADDADADEEFAVSDNTYGITLSEELQFWQNNPSTFRFRFENISAQLEADKSTILSLTFEQVIYLSKVTLFSYNNYSVTNYSEETSQANNTTSLTTRLDAIFPTFYKLFNPTLYTSLTQLEYVENTSRGKPLLSKFGVNLNRPLSKKWYLTLDYSFGSQAADEDSDVYKQQLITLNLDYIY
jgi:hypothetical protein